jgi:hypothetical protein
MPASSSTIPRVETSTLKQAPAVSSLTLRQTESLRAALPGLAIAVLTVLFGFALGGVFGLNEEIVKDRLAASAAAVTTTAYQGDAEAAQPVLAKSWEYMQRAHLHGGAMGTAAIGLIVVMLLIGTKPRATRALGLALGLGALGYSVFWMWAGFLAPGLGSTGAAKESLRWLAMPSAGAMMLATATVAVLCARAVVGDRSGTS